MSSRHLGSVVLPSRSAYDNSYDSSQLYGRGAGPTSALRLPDFPSTQERLGSARNRVDLDDGQSSYRSPSITGRLGNGVHMQQVTSTQTMYAEVSSSYIRSTSTPRPSSHRTVNASSSTTILANGYVSTSSTGYKGVPSQSRTGGSSILDSMHRPGAPAAAAATVSAGRSSPVPGRSPPGSARSLVANRASRTGASSHYYVDAGLSSHSNTAVRLTKRDEPSTVPTPSGGSYSSMYSQMHIVPPSSYTGLSSATAQQGGAAAIPMSPGSSRGAGSAQAVMESFRLGSFSGLPTPRATTLNRLGNPASGIEYVPSGSQSGTLPPPLPLHQLPSPSSQSAAHQLPFSSSSARQEPGGERYQPPSVQQHSGPLGSPQLRSPVSPPPLPLAAAEARGVYYERQGPPQAAQAGIHPSQLNNDYSSRSATPPGARLPPSGAGTASYRLNIAAAAPSQYSSTSGIITSGRGASSQYTSTPSHMASDYTDAHMPSSAQVGSGSLNPGGQLGMQQYQQQQGSSSGPGSGTHGSSMAGSSSLSALNTLSSGSGSSYNSSPHGTADQVPTSTGRSVDSTPAAAHAQQQQLYHRSVFPSLSTALGVQPTAGQGCVGLQNLGNTCFMNSILQSLNAVPELVSWFCKEQASTRCAWGSKAQAAPSYADLLSQMWAQPGGGGVVSPSAFVRRIAKVDSRWGDGSQQDSQEFLHSLLGALQSETNRVSTKPQYRQLEGKGTEEQQALEAEAYARSWNDSVIDDIFGGLLQSSLVCQVCKRQSYCFDPFLDLAVPIPSIKSGISLQDCLRSFVEMEKLDGSESYKCESCKSCQPHTKRLQIYRYPRVLVLTLKRFSSRASTSIFSRFRSAAKNNAAVAIDTDALDLAPFCNPNGIRTQQQDMASGGGPMLQPVYQLISVSHHSGSLEGGHYTAAARSPADGQWRYFNDTSVRKDAKPASPSTSAYVLFFRLTQLQ